MESAKKTRHRRKFGSFFYLRPEYPGIRGMSPPGAKGDRSFATLVKGAPACLGGSKLLLRWEISRVAGEGFEPSTSGL
jgi:hypothetical protein